MAKIAYFVDVVSKRYRDYGQSFLSGMIYQHPLFVSISLGASSETARFLEERVIVQDFWEARKQGVFELPGDQRYFLNDMVASCPGKGLLEVIYRKNMLKKPYTGDLALWRPVTREKGDNLSAALTVADLQSYGFVVLDEYESKITHDSIAPYEDIEIVGLGRVIYHGKNAALIAKHTSEWMNRMDAQMKAAQQDHDQVFVDIARMRWNATENARVSALHAKGWLTIRRRSPY